VTVRWIRRSRGRQSDSWTGLDTALGEDISLYRVQALKAGAVIETIETQGTSAKLKALDADRLHIAQGSTAYGFGAILQVAL